MSFENSEKKAARMLKTSETAFFKMIFYADFLRSLRDRTRKPANLSTTKPAIF